MTHQQHTDFENIVGKGEIAHNERFLLLPQCFLFNQVIVFPFVHIFDIISLFAAELEEPKIGLSGKGLKKADGKLKRFYNHLGAPLSPSLLTKFTTAKIINAKIKDSVLFQNTDDTYKSEPTCPR